MYVKDGPETNSGTAGSAHYKVLLLDVSSYNYIGSPLLGKFVERRTFHGGLDSGGGGPIILHLHSISKLSTFYFVFDKRILALKNMGMYFYFILQKLSTKSLHFYLGL